MMEIVTDNSKVIERLQSDLDEMIGKHGTLSVHCAELQRQNDELVARVARLEESAINLVNVLPHHTGAFVKDAIQDVYISIREGKQKGSDGDE